MGESEFVVEHTGPEDEGATTTRRVLPEEVAEAKEPSLLTILFTDLVESTRMAQSLGDDTAVKILGIHDHVVRAAIRGRGGREVKHTGDGIMAAFPSAAGGVQAAIDIMQGIADHNTETAEPELQVRIGLNAGEPLASHGDLYGLAVSLAARLCDAADPSTILASEAVRVLCLGKGKRFEDRGARTFKGIETPVAVCEVMWQQDAGGE
jgi:adenylate cyclase